MRTLLRTLSLAVVILFLALLAAAKWWHFTPVADLVQAAQGSPALDEAGCVALAERMDAKVAARQKPSAQEQEQFAGCIGEFNCDELAAAANAGKVPTEAVATNAKAMRYTLRTCGNTSSAAQEPAAKPKPEPEPQKSVPGSKFGQPPESKFFR